MYFINPLVIIPWTIHLTPCYCTSGGLKFNIFNQRKYTLIDTNRSNTLKQLNLINVFVCVCQYSVNWSLKVHFRHIKQECCSYLNSYSQKKMRHPFKKVHLCTLFTPKFGILVLNVYIKYHYLNGTYSTTSMTDFNLAIHFQSELLIIHTIPIVSEGFSHRHLLSDFGSDSDRAQDISTPPQLKHC